MITYTFVCVDTHLKLTVLNFLQRQKFEFDRKNVDTQKYAFAFAILCTVIHVQIKKLTVLCMLVPIANQ